MAPIQYYGGKGHTAHWIMPFLPSGKVYVEPYCGAASLFWHLRPPRKVEVLNDLDGDIVNLFRVLQDEALFERLAHRLTWTLYSVDEFRQALANESTEPVDRAWATFVQQNQGFGGIAKTEGNWSRAFVSNRGMAETTNKWRGRLAYLDAWHARLSRVQLDHRDALDVIRYWDSPDTVFYLDPPYIADTRAAGNLDVYAIEASDAHHQALVAILLGLRGQAALSGYDHPICEPLGAAGWQVHRMKTACFAASRARGSGLQGKGAALAKVPRTEVLWVKETRPRQPSIPGIGP